MVSFSLCEWVKVTILHCPNAHLFIHFQLALFRIINMDQEKKRQIFVIQQDQHVQKIVSKLKSNPDACYGQESESGDEAMDRQQSWTQGVVDLTKIRIAWIQRPVIYADAQWVLWHLQKMLYQYHYRQIQQRQFQNQSSSCLEQLIVLSLMKQVIQRYNLKKTTSRFSEALKIWQYSLKQLNSSQSHMKMVFSMNFTEAKQHKKLIKYHIIAKSIENQYYQSLERKALQMLQEEEKGPKKGKKKLKKGVNKIPKQQQVYKVQKQHPNEKILHSQQQHLQKLNKKQSTIAKQGQVHKQTSLALLNSLLQAKLNQIHTKNMHLARLKHTAIQMIFNFVSQQYPMFLINIFGSFITQTCLPNSDIDLILTPSKYEECTFMIFDRIAIELAQKGWVTYCKAIPAAKVPIIKLIVDPFAQTTYKSLTYEQQQKYNLLVKIDITFNTNNSGLISTSFIHGIVTAQPKFKSLLLLVKNIFSLNDLNEGYYGGFSSYSLFIMIIAFVQNQQINMQGAILSQLLIGFFQFITKKCDVANFILRFAKNKPSFLTNQEYNNGVLSKNQWKSSKFRLIDPISGQLINASFSKYDEMLKLFGKWLKGLTLLEEKCSNVKNGLQQSQQLLYFVNMIGL